MARTKRIRTEVVKLLYNKGQQNSRQIHDDINKKLRWGATMQQLGNILARDPRIEKLNGHDRVGGLGFQSKLPTYNVCIWALTDTERRRLELEGKSNDENKV